MGVQVPASEVAERAEVIRDALEADGGFELLGPTEHGEDPITAVHDPGLLAFLRDAWADTVAAGIPHGFLVPETIDNALMTEGMSDAVRRDPLHIAGRSGYRALDTSTPIVEGTYAASRAAVDVALTAVDLVLGGDRAAYGLCRPPGHHASRSMYGGYCYFNNAAIAAEAIARATGEPVAILDVDYHHGNGTEQIFWRRGDVLYVSLHAHPDREYPYFLGWPEETGRGPGRGRQPQHPAAGRDHERAVSRGHGPRPRAHRGPRRIDAGGVARLRHLRARPAGRLRADDRGLPRGRPPGGGDRQAPGDPAGGRLLRARAGRERPGVAARRRGPPHDPRPVQAAARGREPA